MNDKELNFWIDKREENIRSVYNPDALKSFLKDFEKEVKDCDPDPDSIQMLKTEVMCTSVWRLAEISYVEKCKNELIDPI